ncbi:MAG: hypothetical protein IJ833_06935 [Lachnospiraceae bacterium]|nr:hypothetical protein [Lachnospiraceae bacterium]
MRIPMKRFALEFSYEYFSNKAISMLRMLLFAEDMEQLPHYVGESLNGRFDDIVGCDAMGMVGVRALNIKDGHCNVKIQVYMNDLLYDGNRVRARRELYRMYLYKNLSTPINMYFSIRKIQCKSCGASFDATRQRSCPSCGTRYEIGDDDWVILKVEKV